MRSDNLLLADMFEDFWCACHFYSALGLAWMSPFKMIKIKLQLLVLSHGNKTCKS